MEKIQKSINNYRDVFTILLVMAVGFSMMYAAGNSQTAWIFGLYVILFIVISSLIWDYGRIKNIFLKFQQLGDKEELDLLHHKA